MLARGYTFIGLNIVRFLSIVGLILVFASSIFVMVKDVEAFDHLQAVKHNATDDALLQDMLDCDYIMGSTVPNQPAGIFWAVVSRLLIIIQVVILFVSELDLFPGFFDRYFPVLGPSFGLGALGVFQTLIGATILSHHVDDFTLVAAFFLFSVGCLNILLGLIFRESAKIKRSLSAWRDESRGILPSSQDLRPKFIRPSSTFVQKTFLARTDSTEKHGGGPGTHSTGSSIDEKYGYGVGYGFGRQGEKAAASKGFLISKPLESLPRYTPAPSPPTIKVTRLPPPRVTPPSAPSPRQSRFSDPSRYSQPSARRSSNASDVPEFPPPGLTPAPKFKSSPNAL